MASTYNAPGTGESPIPAEISAINSADQFFLILDQQFAPALAQLRDESRPFSENENSFILCKRKSSRHRASGSRQSAIHLHNASFIFSRSGARNFSRQNWG